MNNYAPLDSNIQRFFQTPPANEIGVETVQEAIVSVVPYVFAAASAVFMFSGAEEYLSRERLENVKKTCFLTPVVKISLGVLAALGSFHNAENKLFFTFAFLTPLLISVKSRLERLKMKEQLVATNSSLSKEMELLTVTNSFLSKETQQLKEKIIELENKNTLQKYRIEDQEEQIKECQRRFTKEIWGSDKFQ